MVIREILFSPCFFSTIEKLFPPFSPPPPESNIAIKDKRKSTVARYYSKTIVIHPTILTFSSFLANFSFPRDNATSPPSFPSYLFFLSKFVTLTPLEQKGRCLLKIFNSANSFESTTNLSFQFLRFRQFLLRDDFITCWVKLRTGNSHAILLNW